MADRIADAHRIAKPVFAMLAAGGGHQPFAQQFQQAAILNAVHDDEQTDEEEDRDPFDVAERLMDVMRRLLRVMRPVVEQHQYRGAEHGDGRWLEVERARQHERDHDQRRGRRATASAAASR